MEAWGQKQSSLPLLVNNPARCRRDAPRRWDGRSLTRAVEVEYDEDRIELAPVRFVAVYATQLAQQHAEADSKARRQRGRPRNDEAVEHELVYRLHVTTQVLSPPVATFGWLVLATTVSEHTCNDAEIIRAYRDQTTTVEPGFRWIKNPAAISPVWLEKRERIAALAMLTVVGLLVYGVIQRQGRQYLHQHHASIPGNKGETAIPTATVVFESFASVTLMVLDRDGTIVSQIHGWQAHHRLICQALGLSETW